MGKLAVLLGVVVVVAAAIGVYWFFFADQDEFKSDYTLLDSDDEIKAGMTIKTKTNMLGEESESKYVVESVSDGKVKYRGESNSEGQFEEQLNLYKPTYLDFDYTSSDIPSGVTVTKNGNEYTINGSFKKYSSTYSYDGLKITFDGTNVTSVSGDYARVYESTTFKDNSEYSVSTEGGKVVGTAKYSYNGTGESDDDDFYGDMLLSYDSASFDGPELTINETDGRYGNVKAKIYTINGLSADAHVYKDFEVYVYNGYMLKIGGQVDGKDVHYNAYIYIG